MAGDEAGHTRPSENTRRAERAEYGSSHDADREPTAAEAADAPAEVDEDVRAHAEEMNRIGAETKGEGRLP